MPDNPTDFMPRVTRIQKLSTLLAVIIPFLGFIFAIYSFWGRGFTWAELTSLVVMYLVTGLGITVGYHRLFTHRSFQAVAPVKFLLGVFGSMALQGPVLKWVAIHRRHHHHSDSHDDPHSPHVHGSGIWGLIKGFWHAHIGWMFTANHPSLYRYVRDLNADRLVKVVSNLFGVWVLLGLLIPTGLGWLLTGTWTGAFLGFVWGGLVRIFLVHHATFSINSICHIWGRRPFESEDLSCNNAICGVLALGEGWHNNHHAFPASARHGLFWWQFDMSYLVIRLLEVMRLASNVRVPGPDAVRSKLVRPPHQPVPSEGPLGGLPRLQDPA